MSTVSPTLMQRIRQDVQSMHAYAIQDSVGMVKLDAMENPFGLPPALQAAHAGLRGQFAAAPVPRAMGAGRLLLARHRDGHEGERGPGSWELGLAGLKWLSGNGFSIAVAGRLLPGEGMAEARAGYARLFAGESIGIDAHDPARLVLFPEMDAGKDIAEITVDCWGILGKSSDQIMCASSRMVVHRKGEPAPRVAACTLIPYDPQFDMGATLAEASGEIALNHPHCARFCVLGGASCS